MVDCKTCKHGETLFTQDRQSRFETSYKPYGRAACSKPAYRGRTYLVRCTKPNCDAYERRDHRG